MKGMEGWETMSWDVERFYWPSQAYGGLDSVVVYVILHPHRVTSLKRGAINRAPSLEGIQKGVDKALEHMVWW